MHFKLMNRNLFVSLAVVILQYSAIDYLPYVLREAEYIYRERFIILYISTPMYAMSSQLYLYLRLIQWNLLHNTALKSKYLSGEKSVVNSCS